MKPRIERIRRTKEIKPLRTLKTQNTQNLFTAKTRKTYFIRKPRNQEYFISCSPGLIINYFRAFVVIFSSVNSVPSVVKDKSVKICVICG